MIFLAVMHVFGGSAVIQVLLFKDHSTMIMTLLILFVIFTNCNCNKFLEPPAMKIFILITYISTNTGHNGEKYMEFTLNKAIASEYNM
jgi:hypothetical protein